LVLISLAHLTGCASDQEKSAPAAAAAPAPQAAATAPAVPQTIEEAVNSSYRNEKNRTRDKYRHPAETLSFFGLKPDMTVVEIWPSAGWYAEIIAPLVAEHGQYIAAINDSNGGDGQKANQQFEDWKKSHPEVGGKITTTIFAPPSKTAIAPAGTVDMIVTFRNLHNWMRAHGAQEAFKSFYKALKPGGILGFVEHRASAKGKIDPEAKSGYVRESDVIRMAKKAGFKLVAKSEINANPKDTKDYPEGVWTLPPSYRLKEKDHDKYEAIGESDRMTLKFVKSK
jgi:predicted methyltransferase